MVHIHKRRLLIVLVVLLIAAAVCGIAYLLFGNSAGNQEVLFTPSIEEDTPVYADIVSILPWSENHKDLEDRYILCSCQTTDNETIWVYLTTQEYRDYFNPESRFNFTVHTYTHFPDPVRIHGFAMAGSDTGNCPHPRAFLFQSADIVNANTAD